MSGRVSIRIGARLPTALRQSFFAVEPIHPIDGGRLALAPYQDEQAPIAEAPPFIGQLAQTATQCCLGRTLRQIADHLAISSRNPARPPFREPELGLQVRDHLALHGGRHHFLKPVPSLPQIQHLFGQ
jgi:hypothetical protein